MIPRVMRTEVAAVVPPLPPIPAYTGPVEIITIPTTIPANKANPREGRTAVADMPTKEAV